MQKVTVDIRSNIKNGINSFLSKYYENKQSIGNDVYKWINVFDNPLDAIDIISIACENKDTYQLQIFLTINLDYYIEITEANINIIIKFMFALFYNN